MYLDIWNPFWPKQCHAHIKISITCIKYMVFQVANPIYAILKRLFLYRETYKRSYLIPISNTYVVPLLWTNIRDASMFLLQPNVGWVVGPFETWAQSQHELCCQRIAWLFIWIQFGLSQTATDSPNHDHCKASLNNNRLSASMFSDITAAASSLFNTFVCVFDPPWKQNRKKKQTKNKRSTLRYYLVNWPFVYTKDIHGMTWHELH